jgi:hypothetical protein
VPGGIEHDRTRAGGALVDGQQGIHGNDLHGYETLRRLRLDVPEQARDEQDGRKANP